MHRNADLSTQHPTRNALAAATLMRVRRRASRRRPGLATLPALLALGSLCAVGCRGGEPDASSTQSAATAAPRARLQVGLVYSGPADELGWNAAHERARKALETRFGQKIGITPIDGKNEPAEIEAAITQLITSGNTLIITTNAAAAASVQKLAATHPKVRFVQAGGESSAKNVASHTVRGYEAAYMAGAVAGRMTKSNTLGVVGAFPTPQTVLTINAFQLGAQSINPSAKTRVAWVNHWSDPGKEAGEAQALIGQGADVLFQTTQSPAVLQTAEKAGKFAIGWASDMRKLGPHAHLGSVVIDWAPYYSKLIEQTLEDRFPTGSSWSGVKDGVIDFVVDVHNQVPPDAQKRAATVRDGLKAGTFTPWTGPIADQNGKEILAAGQKADDNVLRALHVYVRGIETTQ